MRGGKATAEMMEVWKKKEEKEEASRKRLEEEQQKKMAEAEPSRLFSFVS